MSFSLHQPDSLIGRAIAGYEITEFIDSGSAGLVFQGKRAANAPAPAEKVGAIPATYPDVAAIKLLAPSFGATEEELADFQRRFQREAGVLKQLSHPHILAVIDSGKDAGTGYFYMVLPYMEGGSLASAIAKRGPPPLPEAAAILAQIADALDFAHGHGIIHRDVKPGNILLDARGAPYLGDFGIMRLLSSAMNVTQRTTIGRVLGSPAYMAPEQFSDTDRVGPLSDLYSLGMVVYQMVTGHIAFETASWPSLIYKQLSETPATPRGARPDLPEPAAAAILHALEKDPAHRFPTATAFAQAFALGLQGQWADDLMEYMATATMPATSIAAPIAPAAAPATPILAAHRAAQTWPNGAAIGSPRQGGPRRSRQRGAVAAAAVLLLVSCLAGIVYLGASGSGQASLSQSASGVGAHTKTAQSPSTATSTAQPPRPTATATKAHSDGGSGGGAPAPTPTDTPTPEPPTPTPTDTPTPEPPTPTPTDTPTPEPPTPTSTPEPQPSISIGWSDAHSHWVWMTLRQFSPGEYTYTCNYGSGKYQTHAIVVSSDPQIWDNAKTCYDKHQGDTLYVSVGPVVSNMITVPET